MERKPPVRMESTEPHSIRFTPTQWAALSQAASRRGEEPSRYVRRLAMYALSIVQAQAIAEDHGAITRAAGL